MTKKLKWEKSIVYVPNKTIRYVGTLPSLWGKYIIEKHGIKHYHIGYYKLFWGSRSHFFIGTAETLKESKQVANNHYEKGVKHA